MKQLTKLLIIGLVIIFVLGLTNLNAKAATNIDLGAADSFAVLGGSTITNTGSSVITGDLGISPGSSVTGFPPGTVIGGAIHTADATANLAQVALTSAYIAADQPCTQNLTGQDLGGLILTPGVYCFDTSAQLTGSLTLNAVGNADAVFIFKVGSTLTTASGSSVVMINDAQACHVFWQIGSSATFNTNTNFKGNTLALVSITLNTGTNIDGRVLARNGAVTLDTNNVTTPICLAATTTTTTTTTTTIPTTTSTTIIPTTTTTATSTTTTTLPSSPTYSGATSTTTGATTTSLTSTTLLPITTVTSIPLLPNTGIAPEGTNVPWNILIPAGLFTTLIILYFVWKRQVV